MDASTLLIRLCHARRHLQSKRDASLPWGSTSDIRNLATRRTQVIDAGGMTVTPGFIDTHCHPSGVDELYGVNLNLRSIAEIKEALRKKASADSARLLGQRLHV